MVAAICPADLMPHILMTINDTSAVSVVQITRYVIAFVNDLFFVAWIAMTSPSL